MKRLIQNSLKEWFESPQRKPLVLKGARQVGKTYAVNLFGREYVEEKTAGKYYYLDLGKEKDLHSIFQENRNPIKILEYIELKKNIKINLGKDLLFLDEIQDCPSAISSLKYFEQDIKHFHLVVAGSHLGLTKNEESFPVGKVNFLSMFPMTFYEFVLAIENKLCPYLDEFDISQPKTIPSIIHEQFLELLLYYFAIGGLPEAILRFNEKRKESLSDGLKSARQVQNELLLGYEADFSKYSGTVNANHIHSVFQSIPKQLSKNYDETIPKFKFSGVIPNQKGFDRIIGPLTWLEKSRLCIKNFIAKKSGHPLLSYTEDNIFKVFYLDIGLLNAALEIPMDVIIRNELSNYKGYIVENFVAQELFALLDKNLTSWHEGQSEIEFLITRNEYIIPIEVKSGMKSRKAKSLDAYIKKYQPQFAYKLSPQNVGHQERGFLTLPLYLGQKIV